MLTEKFKSRRQSLSQLAPGFWFMKQSDDKTAIELFRRGVVELQTSEPNICGHVVAVFA